VIETSLVFDSAQLRAAAARFEPDVLRAARASVTTVSRQIEKELEGATAGAGLGRLARAWQSTVYPKNGLADAPSATIYPKGKSRTIGAITAYATGVTIKGTRGQYLAIPTPAAGSRSTGRGKAPLTPGEWERRTGLRLRFIYRRNRPSLLVLDEGVLSGKTGRARLNTARRRETGRGSTTIPIFILIRQVKVQKRFGVSAITSTGDTRLAADFVARVNVLISQFNAS
jgi:hypothetical protein